MQVEYISIPVNEDSEHLTKSFNGKWPVLELEDGTTHISEALSIARHLSENKLGFYGPDASQKARIN